MKIFLIVISFFTLLGCSSIDKALVVVGEKTNNSDIKKAGAELTPQQEYYLGRSVAAKVFSKSPMSDKEEVIRYINTIGNYLAAHSARPELFKGYHFAVLDQEDLVAMSGPGGFVFISESMIDYVRNEDELAAILAHEIAHIELKHAEKIIKKQKKTKLVKDMIFKGLSKNEKNKKLYQWGIRGIGSVLEAKFDKGQELAADKRAIILLRKAGYNPHYLAKVLRRMKDSSRFLGRHPSNKNRIKKIKGWLKKVKSRGVASSERAQRFSRIKAYLKK